MEMPKPSAGHRRLDELVGDWEGEEKMYPSPWDPIGGVAIGRRQNRVALNGFALITDYAQEREGKITFTGHGVLTFDPKDALYCLIWCDCMGSPPEAFKGRFDGAVLTVAHGGPGMHVRLTHDLGEAGQLLTSMEISQDGQAWKRFFDGRYRRLEAKSA